MEHVPRNKESYKLLIIDKNYIFSRYICPACEKRYGEPSADRFIDIVRCDSCGTFEDVKKKGKRKSNGIN
jgi:hydrogenase maturation factor HypF (carbamoyltransferase family)